jgi:prevent-host-death family protein
MRRIGSREFKNRLGRYLLAVQRGQSLLITDRGRPVAKVRPPDRQEHAEESLYDRLRELEEQGLIRLAKGPMRRFKAVASRGKPASQMLIVDRR